MPLAREALAMWRQLEAESGVQLLTATGCLNISLPGTDASPDGGPSCFAGALASAQLHGLEHEGAWVGGQLGARAAGGPSGRAGGRARQG